MRRWPIVALGSVAAAVVVAALVIGAHGKEQSAHAPAGLKPQMVQALDHYGWHVVPDEQETRRGFRTAAELAGRYGPSTHSPNAVVAGVSLAAVTVGDVASEERADQLMWVVYVEHVTSDCFGPPGGCDGPSGEGTEAILVDPGSLSAEKLMVF
jgi:hypothetical protein